MFDPDTMAAYYADQEMLAEAGHEDDQLSRESIWVTKDKTRIAVKDMLDEHLLNTVRVLRGNSPIGTEFICSELRRKQWLNVMANEIYRRGLQLL